MIDEPLFFKPLMVERVWGGNNLDALYGKEIPPGKTIGESWELSDRPEAQSVVDGGKFNGWTLRQLVEEHGEDILGNIAGTGRFPLLVKYVDAGERLSVQVHPDDDGAMQLGDLGKSECWVIVRVEPGAQVVRGLKPGTTRAQFERAVAEDRVEEVLHYFEPRLGDVIALPAGTVHAIGKGLVVAEVQQNSDLTLRIYDYGRMGLDGQPRKLHVDEALRAIRFDGPGDEFEGDMRRDVAHPVTNFFDPDGVQHELLLKGKYFALYRATFPKNYRKPFFTGAPLPAVFMVVSGSGTIGERKVSAGMTGLFPASLWKTELASESAMVVLLAIPALSQRN